MNRRDLLQSAAWLALGYPVHRLSAFQRVPRFSADPFEFGVASGDPTKDSVVLWTRLMPDPDRIQSWQRESVPVDWQIATDEGMKNVVRSGRELAHPEYGHSVHVDARGLQPNRWYWYRFRSGSAESAIGRTRTAPSGPVDKIRFAFASCQQFHAGFYTAYQHMVQEDIDLVVFLGDYIYESSGGTGLRRVDGPEPTTLELYRKRYATYRSDPRLREIHRLFPWIITWDDHEVDNNYANDVPEHPEPRAEFLKRRADAYQAHYEWLPMPKGCIPVAGREQMYRRVGYGPLLNFFVLDGRQYRSDQPCGDGTKQPCAEYFDDHRTMLGSVQEKWLDGQFQSSRATWNVLANQVRMTPVDYAVGPGERYSMDSWNGYEAARKRLVASMRDRKLSNPVVITGDIHSNWVGDLKIDYREEHEPIIATEFVGTSISTGGDGGDTRADVEEYLREAPQIHFFNAQRGYVRCEVTPASITADYRVVERVSTESSPLSTRASFVVEKGRPGAHRV
jgi:alkaline phosphatase D